MRRSVIAIAGEGLSRLNSIMRKVFTGFCVAVLLCTSLACTPNLTGAWKIQFKRDSWDHFESATCTISQRRHHVIVDCGDETQFVSAKIDGHHFMWQFKSGLNESIFATF